LKPSLLVEEGMRAHTGLSRVRTHPQGPHSPHTSPSADKLKMK
jgi:hypothetical protein